MKQITTFFTTLNKTGKRRVLQLLTFVGTHGVYWLGIGVSHLLFSSSMKKSSQSTRSVQGWHTRTKQIYKACKMY